MSMSGWNEEVLFRVCKNLVHWAQHALQVDEFELPIIRNAILLLKFNGMIKEVKEISDMLVKLPVIDDEFKIFCIFNCVRYR